MFTFQPTRTTQPHKDPFRQQTPQLAAMLSGKPLFGANPQDQQRQMQRLMAMLLGTHRG